MRISSQLLLNFLLNAVWQIALIASLASLGAWLLRSASSRYRHWLWVSALCLAFFVPAVTSVRTVLETITASRLTNVPFPGEEPMLPRLPAESVSSTSSFSIPSFELNPNLALLLIGLYGVFVLYRVFKLLQAWQTTRSIKRNAHEVEPDENISAIIDKCESDLATGYRRIRVLRSETLAVPVTLGLVQPAIILPDSLLREGNDELLTSAIGHELIHVTRKDYLLNIIYELLYIPISFHPAAALLRRRIKQTRELCCDELVAARILNAEVYARSLLQLAGSAPALRRLSVTTTVGIADADILEARIMSLLSKPKNPRWKKTLLFVVLLLLLVPCAAAAAFNMRFDVEANEQDRLPQEQKEKVRQTQTELEKQKIEMATRQGTSADVIKQRIAADPALESEIERRREFELEMRAVTQAALVKLARISMEQAIQVATSQQPGKVLLATLGAKGWEEPGKLGKDGVVFYHVQIADEANGLTHVFVNALDGSVIKTEKELPRKQRSADNP
ncbi:MAG TPA: M56 family metallopeptidase [Pyrinomonadaceae bacterium]|nr:M56 family metallopeptidase [Pyrinomonadaceae bacterium]